MSEFDYQRATKQEPESFVTNMCLVLAWVNHQPTKSFSVQTKNNCSSLISKLN